MHSTYAAFSVGIQSEDGNLQFFILCSCGLGLQFMKTVRETYQRMKAEQNSTNGGNKQRMRLGVVTLEAPQLLHVNVIITLHRR